MPLKWLVVQSLSSRGLAWLATHLGGSQSTLLVSAEVADVQSRILEVEGSVEFAREKDNTSLFPVSEAAEHWEDQKGTPPHQPSKEEAICQTNTKVMAEMRQQMY
eukprot:6406202-Amphidinium_carterae.1